MIKNINLKAVKRTEEHKNLERIRQENQIPGVVYGHGIENTNVLVAYNELDKIHQAVGESSLFDLVIEGGNTVKVVIKDITRHPVSGRIEHVDFYQVNMNEEMTATVAIELVGESRAVKDLGGVLVKTLDELEIECLPGDLISHIEIDISKLNELGDSIRISDLEVSDKVRITNDPETTIVLAEEPRVQEEETLAPAEETPDAATDADDKDAKDNKDTKDEKPEEKKEDK